MQRVCQLGLKGATAEGVIEAVTLKIEDRGSLVQGQLLKPGQRVRHELRVAYELLLDSKRHKLRIADVVLAQQDVSRTPPASSPLRVSIGSSTPPASNKVDMSRAVAANAVMASQQSQQQPARRRR